MVYVLNKNTQGKTAPPCLIKSCVLCLSKRIMFYVNRSGFLEEKTLENSKNIEKSLFLLMLILRISYMYVIKNNIHPNFHLQLSSYPLNMPPPNFSSFSGELKNSNYCFPCCMGVGLTTGAHWKPVSGLILQKEQLSLVQQLTADYCYCSSARGVTVDPLSHLHWLDSVMVTTAAGSSWLHQQCYLWNVAPHIMPPHPLLPTLFLPPFQHGSLSFGSHKVNKMSHVTLWLAMYLFLDCCPLQKEAPLAEAENSPCLNIYKGFFCCCCCFDLFCFIFF